MFIKAAPPAGGGTVRILPPFTPGRAVSSGLTSVALYSFKSFREILEPTDLTSLTTCGNWKGFIGTTSHKFHVMQMVAIATLHGLKHISKNIDHVV